ncbi:MAG: hypothetical protein IT581_20065, partial [Verrucomicrobiales bacterium]|nr:hypothetical protein [Verrucomicrobiales bacterium]
MAFLLALGSLRSQATEVSETCCLALPAAPSNEMDGVVRVTYGSPAGKGVSPEFSFFTVDVQPGGTGGSPVPPVPAGRYAGWCFDRTTEIDPAAAGTLFGGTLYSSCDPTVSFNDFLPDHPNVKKGADTWKKINYLLNHRFAPCSGLTPTMWEVQTAISLIFGQGAQPSPPYPSYRSAVVNCLINEANANAASWSPKCGDKIAAIFNIDVNWDDLVPDVQLIFIEVPCPCTSLGDYVWNDTSLNGIQDEPATSGVNGVQVNLLDCNDLPVKDAYGNNISAITANDSLGNPGYYLFTNLVASCYHVEFVLPAGYAFTTQNASGSTAANGSDADLVSGRTTNINLAYGAHDRNWDAGIYQPAKIGDLVFNDTNANGQQDGGELGVDGVTVELFRCSDNSMVGSTTTIGGGLYGFTVP